MIKFITTVDWEQVDRMETNFSVICDLASEAAELLKFVSDDVRGAEARELMLIIRNLAEEAREELS